MQRYEEPAQCSRGHRYQGPWQGKVTLSVHAEDGPTFRNLTTELLTTKRGPEWQMGKTRANLSKQGEEGEQGRRRSRAASASSGTALTRARLTPRSPWGPRLRACCMEQAPVHQTPNYSCLSHGFCQQWWYRKREMHFAQKQCGPRGVNLQWHISAFPKWYFARISSSQEVSKYLVAVSFKLTQNIIKKKSCFTTWKNLPFGQL